MPGALELPGLADRRNVLQRLSRLPRPACGERSKFACVTRGFRVRGRLRVGGVTDRDITIAFNHRLRVVFSGAPHPESARFTCGLRAPRASFARLVPARGER